MSGAPSRVQLPGGQLLGRDHEREALDRLLERARASTGGVLMLHGDPGVGKSALLEYVVHSGRGFRLARTVGVEGETELAFAALQQLCSSFLAFSEHLPEPQREALGRAFGLSAGPPANPFLVGLAVLGLMAEAAEEQPLLCIVDDAQWLDSASAQVLSFVARRLLAERIALVFATRDPGDELRDLPGLEIRGLHNGEARALLNSTFHSLLDEQVRSRIVFETHGNPLALLELPRGLTPTQLTSGLAIVGAGPLTAQVEKSFKRRLERLPGDSRLLLLLAAAEPVGDPLLLWRAAETLDISPAAAAHADVERLLTIGAQVTFRHPLVRSAVYGSASPERRRSVHVALAEVTDRALDPDRRAWHLAAAASGPDEAVASELEHSAGRAQARGGLAAAAALLQRSVELTGDPARRADRALAAAWAHLYAGAFDDALAILPPTEAGSADDLHGAKTELLRGEIAFASNLGGDAPPLLLSAARRLEEFDVDLARETYLDAWGAAWFAGNLATSGDLLEVSRAARSAPPSTHPPRALDLLLDGLALLITEGRAAAAPALRDTLSAFAAADDATENSFRWTALAPIAAYVLWDDESWHAINARQLEFARQAGALATLPMALSTRSGLDVWSGEFAKAIEAISEATAIVELTGTHFTPYTTMLLGAFQGREADVFRVLDTAIDEAAAVGQGLAAPFSELVKAILFNGLGRYGEALAAAQTASNDTRELFISSWALPELIEAASRSGFPGQAADALKLLSEDISATGTEWGLGIAARSRALVVGGDAAEPLYREAVERLARTRLRPELARAHLLYGEWLRREPRRVDARAQLRIAHEMFMDMGMDAFAERARVELEATGERARKRTIDANDDLTPQEAQVARLAAEGNTNREIAAQLFISSSTVEYHLRKAFRKLDVKSRTQLTRRLS